MAATLYDWLLVGHIVAATVWVGGREDHDESLRQLARWSGDYWLIVDC